MTMNDLKCTFGAGHIFVTSVDLTLCVLGNIFSGRHFEIDF